MDENDELEQLRFFERVQFALAVLLDELIDVLVVYLYPEDAEELRPALPAVVTDAMEPESEETR